MCSDRRKLRANNREPIGTGEVVVHFVYYCSSCVVLVVVLFLQSFPATIIPLLAIPVSLVGTFAAMAALGYSINTLTLFALVLAVGIVVDDAIVVVENVERYLREGLSAKDAAVGYARQQQQRASQLYAAGAA